MKGQYKRYPYKKLKDICKEIFMETGIYEEGSEIIADCLVNTSARGVSTHGVTRMKMYTKSLTTNDINPNVKPEIIKEEPPIALIDGKNGMGHINSYKAVKKAIEIASEFGIASVGVKGSTHFGAAAHYALEAIKSDMIGIVLTNTPALMFPTGGIKKLIGNNPFAIGVPSHEDLGCELVLDMAISKVSNSMVRTKAKKAIELGELLPEGWILDSNGNPSKDPNDYSNGSIIPIGNHKGYGLAFMVDILTGVLMDSAFNGHVGRRHTPENENVGHNMIVIDPEAFMPIDTFKDKVSIMVNNIWNSGTADGVDKVYVPGEIESRKEKESMKIGVPVAKSTVKEINEILNEFNITKQL